MGSDTITKVTNAYIRKKHMIILFLLCVGFSSIAMHFVFQYLKDDHSDHTPIQNTKGIISNLNLDRNDRPCVGFECFITPASEIVPGKGGVRCPCCGNEFDKFDDHPTWSLRKGAICPYCKSMERHRLSCFDIGYRAQDIAPIYDWNNFKLLHFGPHNMAAEVLDAALGENHFKVDYFAKGYTYTKGTKFADVTDLDKTWTNKFDGVINLHVMEHIPKRQQGFSEIRRVLKPGGWFLFEAPCTFYKKTVDCRDLKTDKERKAKCNQYDHVWDYNCGELRSFVEQEGFDCIVAANKVPDKEIEYYYRDLERYGRLPQQNHIQYICT